MVSLEPTWALEDLIRAFGIYLFSNPLVLNSGPHDQNLELRYQ